MPRHSTLCLSDTPYQLSVQQAAALPDAIYLHWNARRAPIAEAEGLRTVASSRVFLREALRALPGAERVVIGDFRSGAQLFVIFAAILLRRPFVLADDGLVNQMCDRLGYHPRVLATGGLTAWKAPFVWLIRDRLARAPRISTFPRFTERWSKAAYTLASSKRPAPAAAAPLRRIVFVGQPTEITGVSPSAVREALDRLADEWDGRAELFYAPHPREVDPAGLAGERWRLRRGSGLVEADPDYADGATLWVGLTSTALLEGGGRGDRVRIVDARALGYDIPSRRPLHVQAQQVMCDIAAAEGMTRVELWSPTGRGESDG